MIYFLVNNDYQLLDARQHLAGLSENGRPVALIEVPHYLNSSDRGRGFASVTTFASPLRSHGWLAAWPRYFASWHAVWRRLRPAPDDVLFLYTEFELLNHFVAKRFKAAGAKVYMIEDGGFATYVPLSLPSCEALTIKERVVAAMSRCLPQLSGTVFHKVNGVVFPWLPDEQLDGVCVYRDIDTARDVPVRLLQRPALCSPVARQAGRVIFLNERMYDLYQTQDQYFAGLGRILEGLTQGFSEVLFKFHPSESAEWRHRIDVYINKAHPNVRLLNDNRSIEGLLVDYQPEVLASYFSAALLNLEGSGVEPLYLYHLIDEVASQKAFALVTKLLKQWNYCFVDTMAGARRGYRSGLAAGAGAKTTTLAALVDGRQ